MTQIQWVRCGYAESRKSNGLWVWHMAQFAPGNLTASYKSPSISCILIALNAKYDLFFMEHLCYWKELRLQFVFFNYNFLTASQTMWT